MKCYPMIRKTLETKLNKISISFHLFPSTFQESDKSSILS